MRFEGIGYRAHEPKWAYAPHSGQGAAINGGRFNPNGTPALYLSLSVETAIKEATAAAQAIPLGGELSVSSSKSLDNPMSGAPFGRECREHMADKASQKQRLGIDCDHMCHMIGRELMRFLSDMPKNSRDAVQLVGKTVS